MAATGTERVQTLVVGGGQAGLSVGYHLRRLGLPFVILEANPRDRRLAGGPAGTRSASSPRRASTASPGCRFPLRPTPSRRRTRWPPTSRRTPRGSSYPCGRASGWSGSRGAATGTSSRQATERLEADNVVVAMATYQRPRVPACAKELDAGIVQLHSQRVPEPRPAPRGRRPRRGRRQLRGRDRPRGRARRSPDVDVGEGRRADPVPHRGARRTARSSRASCSGSCSTAC